MEEGQEPRATPPPASPPLEITPVQEEEAEAADQEGETRRERDNHDDGDDDFEFVFVCDDPDAASPADEIFYDGKIRPVYPVSGSDIFLRPSWFGKNEEMEEASVRNSLRKLLVEEESERERERAVDPSCSSSESDELDGVPEESYCVWTPGSASPSPDMKKKSKSTGSSATSFSRRWSLRDLVVRRSHSDGKKNLVFVTPTPQAETRTTTSTPSQSGRSRRNSVESGGSRKSSVESGESGRRSPRRSVEKSTRGRMHYVKREEGAAAAVGGDHRRSYLPYRTGIFGIFAGVNGNGPTFHHF